MESHAVETLARVDLEPARAVALLAARAEAARAWTGPIRLWLAARAFASWLALQGEGLRTTVLGLRLALAVLMAELRRGGGGVARRGDQAALLEAFRRADMLLIHLADPVALARRLSRSEVIGAADHGVVGSPTPVPFPSL